jgi:hypothetical protein
MVIPAKAGIQHLILCPRVAARRPRLYRIVILAAFNSAAGQAGCALQQRQLVIQPSN